ncbi:MAG: HNH endonuclease signature motif containing protein [Sandaracinus sp.]
MRRTASIGTATTSAASVGRDERLDALEARAHGLSATWDEAEEYSRRTAERYREATHAWEAASSSFDSASDGYREARETWERARIAFDFATELVMIAAAIDAANLDAFRARRIPGVERADLQTCDSVSTRTFRRRLEAQGRDLTGLDVDHIVPRSLGGPDHPLNYQLLDASTNRSLGAAFGAEKCQMVGLGLCAAAVAISQRCGGFTGAMPL